MRVGRGERVVLLLTSNKRRNFKLTMSDKPRPNSVEPKAVPLGGERRQSTRFQLCGDASFEWRTQDGQLREGKGKTQDIGKFGAFVKSELLPPADVPIKLTIVLKAESINPLRAGLSGSGIVRHVRSDLDGGFRLRSMGDVSHRGYEL